jgi:hypothetical protein
VSCETFSLIEQLYSTEPRSVTGAAKCQEIKVSSIIFQSTLVFLDAAFQPVDVLPSKKRRADTFIIFRPRFLTGYRIKCGAKTAFWITNRAIPGHSRYRAQTATHRNVVRLSCSAEEILAAWGGRCIKFSAK